jgi:hypothetical protein
MALFTMMHGVLRIYDSTATAFYINIPYTDGNVSAPDGRPRVEETSVLDRGRGSVGVHNIAGIDDPVIGPLDLSFSLRMQNVVATMAKIRNALSNPDNASPWLVGSDTWVTTKGDFTLTGGNGATFTDPAFEDATKVCVNVEILWTRGGASYGRKYGAVYFPPDQVSLAESADGVVLSVTGKIYGTITTITSFTAGNAS